MTRVPLRLWNQTHWELRGKQDCAAFFRRIGEALPAATTLFIEGTCIAPDVRDFLESNAEPGDYLPERQTIWPNGARYRLPFHASALAGLAALAERHAEPELLDHLFVYSGDAPLLEYPDAMFRGNCPIFVSSGVDESKLRTLAAALGLELARIEPR